MSRHIAAPPRAAMHQDESHRYVPFQEAPIGIWEEDYSEVKRIVDELKAAGVRDFRKHFSHNPDDLRRAINAIRLIDINETALGIYGAAGKAELDDWLHKEYPTGSQDEFYLHEISAFAEGANDHVFEHRIYVLDGSSVETRTVSHIAEAHRDTWARVVSTEEDITWRKKQERMEIWQRTILERLATGADLGEILGLLCSFTEAMHPETRCAILLMDPDQRRLRHGAAPSMPDAYNRAVDGIGIGPKAGSCGTAAFLRERVIVENVFESPLWDGLHDLVRDAGFAACWSQPILSSAGEVLGTFALYNDEPRKPTPRELDFIKGQAQLASVAIERMRSQDALRKSEEHFRQLVEETNIIAWELDLATRRFTYVSPHAGRLLGYPPEDWYAEGFWESRIHADDRERARAVCDAANEKGDDYKLEYRMVARDGSEVWLRDIATVVTEDGRPVSLRGFMVDVSDEKRAERSLRESEERFRNVFAYSRAGMAILAEDGTYEQVNQAFCDLLGYEERDFVGKHWKAFTHPDDVMPGAAYQRRVVDGEIPSFRIEKRYIAKDGRSVWCDAVCSILATGGGRPRQLVVQVHDISERKRAEESARETEARFRTFIDQMPAAVSLKDPEGRYIIVNKTFNDWFNPDGDDLEGRTVGSLVPSDHAETITSLEHAILETRAPITRETEVPLADGNRRPAFIHKFPLVDADGSVTAIGTIETDCTDLREAEARLRQAQRMEAVGQLTGGIAHDFNNLLNIIQGNLELLVEQLDPLGDAKLSEFADSALRAALRGSDLTRHLLVFSRSQVLEPSIIDLNDVITEMHDLLARTLGEDIDVVVTPSDDLPLIRTDAAQLENAIVNLAINARDAMPDGGKLDIRTMPVTLDDRYAASHTDVRAGDYACIAISDTGRGMPEEVRTRAFEPFFTTKDAGKGTGLGLAMIYGFAKQSGGHAAIYSEPGIGTTIRLYFPVYRGEAPRETPKRRKDVADMRGSETVLVVEDNPDLMQTARSMLESLGYTVLAAGTPSAALDAIEAHPDIDVLFTDVILPGGMNGVALAHEIRARRPDLPVLFTTGYAEDALSLGEGAVDAGEWLAKPFTMEALGRKLRSTLEKGISTDPTTTTD